MTTCAWRRRPGRIRSISTAWKAAPAPARMSRPKIPAFPASPRSARPARRWTTWASRARSAWSMPAASATAATWRRRWRLGADAVAIGHSALMALNCNKDIPEADFPNEIGCEAGYCYHCHTGRCPVGVATQDPVLRARLDPDEAAERVYNFLHTPHHRSADDGPRLRQDQHPLAGAGRSGGADHGSLGHGARCRSPARSTPSAGPT